MEELIVYDADVTEVLDLLATFYDDLLWWEDLEVYQNWDEVISNLLHKLQMIL